MKASVGRSGAPVELGILLCSRARLAKDEGDLDEARRLLAEARALADKVGAGPSSELGRLLTEAQKNIEEE